MSFIHEELRHDEQSLPLYHFWNPVLHPGGDPELFHRFQRDLPALFRGQHAGGGADRVDRDDAICAEDLPGDPLGPGQLVRVRFSQALYPDRGGCPGALAGPGAHG